MTAFRSLLAALLLAGAGLLQAQTPPPRPVGPAVWIPPQPGQQPIRLDEVSIQIQTAGFIARTRIELSFHNPNARVLEGEFVFPLAAGQTVSGYALEVEGRMREGVVVPKQTARVAFEDISRQQIDPGLAELTKGNVFRTRLYPIPARGNKRVALSFEQIMPLEGGQYRYLLPLAFEQTVARFSVRAEAALGAAGGTVASPDPSLRFDRSGQAWIASFTRENVQPQRELAFAIPRAAGDAEQLEAADTLEPAWRSVLAQVDSGRPASLTPLAAPRRIALFVDASGSAAQRDLARERAVLQRYLAGLGELEVALVAFRDAAEAPRRFRLRRGDVGALIEAIAALPLDGGSSYGAIDLSVVPDADLVLVLGDGLSNFAAADPKLGKGAPRLFVLHAAQQADHAALERIARRGGGRVLDLLQLDADAALAALTRPEWGLLSTEVLAGRCEQLLPQAPLAVEARLLLSARCEGRARLRLRFGQAGRGEVVRELAVGSAAPVDAALAETVHRLHAQARIAELERAAKPDAEAIAALGTQYGVVTRHTSLLVLDRIEDYLRYRIEPKEDDLRAQYRARLPDWPKSVATDDGKAQRIATLAALWRGFRDWHRTRHPWLETLLLPAVEAESAEWRRFVSGTDETGKRVAAARRRIDELQAQARALQARWPSEGADAASRARWEREATAVMLAVDDLRGERSGLPAVAAVAMDREERDGDLAGLDRIEVTGSRITREDLADASMPSEMAVPAAPPPATAPAPMAELAAQAAPRRVGSNEAAKREGEADAAPPVRARISLRGWNPDTPYLAAIRAAADPYRAYLEQRAEHGDTPAFFLDCADHFRDALKDPVLALRILSNIAELGSENTALTRVLGYRLAQWQRFDLAVGQFEDALAQRPEEPQSHRDLALALARQAQPDVARAVELLWTVASGDWHGRFPEIELIALHELNDLLARGGVDAAALVAELGIPGELIDPLRVGLRVSMTWDADNTDIDLWVIDPTGEPTYYGQNRSRAGGHVSRDFTQGYGPEVYTIARPLPGTYRVRAHYFGDRRQSLTGPVTVQVEFQTGFGSGQDARESITRRLESGREWIDLGEFRVEAAPGA